MIRTIAVIMLLGAVAPALGQFATGGSELLRFRGTGLFRWERSGLEGADPEHNMTACAIADWLPKLNHRVDGQFSLELYAGSGMLKLTDLFLNLHLSENLALRGGQFKLPFGYAYTLSSATMPFAHRAAVVGTGDFNAYGGRDIGACVTASAGRVRFDLAFSNGTGDNQTADTTISNQMTARVAADPLDWMQVGVSAAVIGRPEQASGEVTVDSWSGLGLDLYTLTDFTLTETARLHFAGEYMNLGFAGPEVETLERNDAHAMLFTLAASFETGSEAVQTVRPAVRYEILSPMTYYTPGNEPEDNKTALDFCLNLDLFSPSNTLQIGGRTYGYENPGINGYTDVYVNWRMNF